MTGNADKALARALATRRVPYALAGSESAADLVAIDPATGVVPLYLVQNGTLFEYDSLDTTTVASAICLVTSDSKRYKSGGITPPYSVLTVGTTAQPVSPTLGDTYLIPTAATGTDWAGQDGKIGIYSRAGWQFAISPIGRGLYAEDTNIRWYRNAAGTWVSGFGGLVIGDSTFASSAIIGAGAAFIRKVENQTETTAPASPVAPVAYIVAGNGGAWSAYNVGDLAICNVDGAWTRSVPAVGDEVYDKSLNVRVRWNGTAWAFATGSIIGHGSPQFTAGTGSTSAAGSSPYSISATAPTTSAQRRIDDVSVTYTAKVTGTRTLRISWEADVAFSYVGSGGSGDNVIALYRGSETDAIAWQLIHGGTLSATDTLHQSAQFFVDATGGVSKTYKIAVIGRGTGGDAVTASSFSRRTISLDEYGS